MAASSAETPGEGGATAQAQQLRLDRGKITKWAPDGPAWRRAEVVDDRDAQPELSEAHHELPAVGLDGRRPCLASVGPGLSNRGPQRTSRGRRDRWAAW